jgi:CRISPR-associated protein Cas4
MDGYISFSQLNDFLFCPQSLYIHTLYHTYHTSLYHDTPQIDGKAAHETIDQGTYERGGWLTGLPLCSPTYRIFGKCDLYHPDTGVLVERKRTIRKIYNGQKLQVWAQAICLVEMGYPVREIYLHSLTDNTRYPIPIPDASIRSLIVNTVVQIERYVPDETTQNISSAKCAHCIYASLCPHACISDIS